ncbi:hypothetical protein [Paraconexibacter sp.]|uniref:hypothetical protein n=1 Tax=Paraconexibacter sp. TaxID=2949640 RepID=UPI0035660698
MTLIRDRSLGELLDAAFALYRSHLKLFLLLAAGVVVPVDLVVSGIGLGQLTAGYEENPTVAEALLPAAVSAVITVPLITAMQVRAILAIERGEQPTVGQAVREGLDVFAPVLAVVIMVGLAVFAGFLALIVPGIILLAHLSVSAQAVVVENRRGTDALRRSWNLVRGNAWWVLAVIVVINLLAGVLGALVTLPAASAAQSADSALILLIATMIVEPFTLSFQALATTILFFTLLARSESGLHASSPVARGGEERDAIGRLAGTPAGPADRPGDHEPAADRAADHEPAGPPADWEPPASAPPGWEPPRPGR